MMQRRRLAVVIALAVVLAGVAVLAYRLVIPGLSSARQEPPAAEVTIATWLLHESVPAEAIGRINPLGKDPVAIAAGQDLFRQKCAVCHAYDGSGKTEIGAGEYPRPPALRSMNIMALTDGEMFYHIRNGIRNTGMPAWSMPDEQDIAVARLAGARADVVGALDHGRFAAG
jgi:mono/diheme cytochrome c family protein